MIKIIQKIFLITICLLFIGLVAIGLGALGEDYSIIGNDLNHILSKTMIIILIYLALKLPIAILLKVTIINGCCAIISWKATVKKDYFKKLFTFRRKEVYYVQRKSLAYEIKKIIPLFNKNISLENKFRFCINPVRIAIAIISCFTEYWIYIIDTLTDTISPHLHKKNHESYDTATTVSITVSPFLPRALKGIVVIISELTLSILKSVRPISDIPYWIAYFFAIFLPDHIVNLFSSSSNRKINNINIPTDHLHNNLSQLHHKNSKYIKEQLDNEKLNDSLL